MTIDLARLADPFPEDSIEWRVSRSGKNRNGIFCIVLAYITARAIQERLDEVCGPENWRNEPPRFFETTPSDRMAHWIAVQAGISIRIDDEWITKWDVSEPTNIEPAKGGFSGAMKRAGAQWGIGRYLYWLDETFAEVSEKGGKGWNYAKTKDGEVFYWLPPSLPGWAVPKEEGHEISEKELTDLKKRWMKTYAEGVKAPAELAEGFRRFVVSVVGEFPMTDYKCWTRDAYDQCGDRILATAASPNAGVSSDVPFEDA